MMTKFKTLATAAAFATVGFAAQAATVAEITTEGFYLISTNGQTDAITLEGSFTAFLDTGFNTAATNDFLFDLDLEATGLDTIDEELLVTGVTGDDIIGIALSALFDIDLAFPGAIDSILDEVQDGDTDQTEIGSTGIFFGFGFEITALGANSASGLYAASLSDGLLAGVSATTSSGTYDGSATISTIAAVPLPATLPLLAFAGAGLMALGRRRKAAA